jgi:hypothetical protein
MTVKIAVCFLAMMTLSFQPKPALAQTTANPPKTAVGSAGSSEDLRGGWQAESYTMASGKRYEIRGQILFVEKNWTVLFMTMDNGKVVRGSGEGGTYAVSGNHLTFTHRYWVMPPFDAIPGLKEQKSRVETLGNGPKYVEAATYEIRDNRLTLHMPSDNTLTFVRSSAP